MFGYYGGKYKLVDYYPSPKMSHIVEPFAGSAQYALRWFDRDVTLIDRDSKIVGIWNWLKECSISDVMGLPDLGRGGEYNKIVWSCQAEADFMGYLIKYASADPGRKVSANILRDRPNRVKYSLEKAAGNLYKIKHWKVVHGSYEDAEDIAATWFIDPPYVCGGHKYKYGSSLLNYHELAKWCLSRKGQLIVCENGAADWLPFRELKMHKGGYGSKMEKIYTTEPYFVQQKLF